MADETDIPKTRKHKGAIDDLSAEYVRSLLDYSPDNGELRWKVSMPPRGRKGELAGWQQPSGRRKIAIHGQTYMTHRLIWLIMTGEWPPFEIDHDDLNQSNNRWGNLRKATSSQNQSNRPRRRNNKTGITGVCWDSTHQRWLAFINKRHIGTFHSFQAAISARKTAEERIHGEFAHPDSIAAKWIILFPDTRPL
jgi:hypothetical protein